MDRPLDSAPSHLAELGQNPSSTLLISTAGDGSEGSGHLTYLCRSPSGVLFRRLGSAPGSRPGLGPGKPDPAELGERAELDRRPSTSRTARALGRGAGARRVRRARGDQEVEGSVEAVGTGLPR